MMRHEFRATIPLPPSVNDWLKPGKTREGRARLVKTGEAEDFLESCRARLLTLSTSKALHRGPLELYLTVYVPSLASDGGNRLKMLEDALKGLVIDDDRQFVEWHIVKRIDPKVPRAELVIRQADPREHEEVARRLVEAETRPKKPRAPRPSGAVRPRSARLPAAFAGRLQPAVTRR
jgi:Holliday junction resolvase RusA-like endonuclease